MKCVVLIPIYKTRLDIEEERNVRHSLKNLDGQNCEISWLAPDGLEKNYYSTTFPSVSWSLHAKCFFNSVSDYSRLLLSNHFYETYFDYEFMLILQPDAVVLRPNLDLWLASPYDYIGAPWPRGWEYPLPIRLSGNIEHVVCRAFIGNGGLSLRRPFRLVQLLNEFPEARSAWMEIGNPEDLLISLIATMSSKFLMPSIGVASKFSIELDFDFFLKLHGTHPFGVHAKSVCNKAFDLLSI
jgi:hypothetical protein